MTIYVITHDQEFIAACCDHVLHMRDGEIVSDVIDATNYEETSLL